MVDRSIDLCTFAVSWLWWCPNWTSFFSFLDIAFKAMPYFKRQVICFIKEWDQSCCIVRNVLVVVPSYTSPWTAARATSHAWHSPSDGKFCRSLISCKATGLSLCFKVGSLVCQRWPTKSAHLTLSTPASFINLCFLLTIFTKTRLFGYENKAIDHTQ